LWESLIPAGNEPSGCASIHLANAARVNNPTACSGVVDLRHTLNDFLKDLGHCGYSVRPSERRKGFATEMLRQLLEVAKKAGMNELYLSVEKKNEPSVKTITRNGGVYQRSFEYDGEQADIYRIAFRRQGGKKHASYLY